MFLETHNIAITNPSRYSLGIFLSIGTKYILGNVNLCINVSVVSAAITTDSIIVYKVHILSPVQAFRRNLSQKRGHTLTMT
jgi:hypothetical protein